MANTIAAIATPNAAGGIGIIRISGDDAFSVTDRIFHSLHGKKAGTMQGYTAAYGRVCDSDGDIDEAVCLVYRAPHSYTGENVAEISCHGGVYVTQRVLRAALEAGAEPAQPGEFTKRAFLNGKMSLDEAEAVMGIISAQGDDAAKAALTALDGALSRKMEGVCQLLAAASAQLAAWVDYPYEEIEELEPKALGKVLTDASEQLRALLDSFDSGRAVMQGVQTVIVGRPNTGKSTLMNMLSGYERSIVTEIAGTTRDVIEQTVRIGNVVLCLADTAGIHTTDDTVESIGVNLAVRQLERASLALAVLDGSQPLSDEDRELLVRCKGTKTIAVVNKEDLIQRLDVEALHELTDVVVTISAKDGTGRKELEKAVCDVLGTTEFDPTSAMLTTERQRKCVLTALQSIDEAGEALLDGVTLDAVTVCIDSAIEALLALTGKKASEAVVDEVFSRFCVGK